MQYILDTSQVTSVWSAHGHHFMPEDGGMEDDEATYERCIRCGAMYQLLAHADDPTRGEYLAADGSEPMECSGDTSMVHGYPGERVCEADNGRPCNPHNDDCVHVAHNCNCLFCNS